MDVHFHIYLYIIIKKKTNKPVHIEIYNGQGVYSIWLK